MIPTPRAATKQDPDELRQLAHVRDDLVREFDRLTPAVVDRHVTEQVRHFDSAAIRSFVPVLVRRGARERLRRLA